MTDFTYTSPQAVSRALGKAGFKRAETSTTAVRGYYRTSPGFRVEASSNTGDIIVTLRTGLNVHTDEHKAETTSKITAMAEALTKAGYVANIDKARTMVLVLGKAV